MIDTGDIKKQKDDNEFEEPDVCGEGDREAVDRV